MARNDRESEIAGVVSFCTFYTGHRGVFYKRRACGDARTYARTHTARVILAQGYRLRERHVSNENNDDNDDDDDNNLYPLHFSPTLLMVTYEAETDYDNMPTCMAQASSTWSTGYVLTKIVLFFVIPLLILIVLYTMIARHLMANPAISRGPANNLLKYRKQVVLMLGTVVLFFFLCLLPFNAFTLWLIFASPRSVLLLGIERYYSLVYFCRMMLYVNSAINPILYNLMSTKFREGFLRLCGLGPVRRKKKKTSERTGTYTTGSTNCSSSHSDFWRRHSSNKSCSVKVPCTEHESVTADKQIKLPLLTAVVAGSIVRKKQESYV